MIKDNPLLVDTGRGYTIKYKSKYLYSSVEPIKSVLKRIQKIEIEKNTLVYIPGFGLGYGLKELLEKINDSSHILCIEADMKLMAFALKNNIEPVPVSPEISVIRADNPSKIIMHIKKLGIHRFRRVVTIHLCAGYNLHKETYEKIGTVLDDEIKSFWQNKMTLIHMGRLWIKNILHNLPLIYYSNDLDSMKTELPILITGAGPSLEESKNWIKKIRKNVILFAVDTALPFLDACGITPDIILILESQHINLQDFIPNTFSYVPVICDISSSPSVTKIFKNNIYFFSSDFYPLKLFRRMSESSFLPQSIPPLGSVGVASVYIAKILTSGPVILCGLDFSYTYNRTHAKNTAFNMLMLQTINRLESGEQVIYSAVLKRPLLKMTGKKNISVLTDLILLFYSNRIKEVINNSERIFDIGPLGLKTGALEVNDFESLKKIVSDFNNCDYIKRINEDKDCSLSELKMEKVNKFIKKEKEILDNTIIQLENLLEVEIEKEDIKKLDFLKELDYLYFNFPDKKELPCLNKNFLARTLKSAYDYGRVFKKLINIIKNN